MIQISRSSRDRAVSGVVAPPRWVGGLRAPLSLPASLSRGGVGLDTSLRDQTSSRRSSRVSWRIGRVTAVECGSFLWTTPRTRGVCGGCLGEPALCSCPLVLERINHQCKTIGVGQRVVDPCRPRVCKVVVMTDERFLSNTRGPGRLQPGPGATWEGPTSLRNAHASQTMFVATSNGPATAE